MKYQRIVVTEFGQPNVLRVEEANLAEPGPGEVRVRVQATGVAFADILMRYGVYPGTPKPPFTPGYDIAGTVDCAGPGISEFRPGDAVVALTVRGGYAEYASAPAPQVLPVPAGFDMAQAAGIPETFFTVWTNVFDRGHLAEGESILIHGGSSGIGTTAIQLACAFGATAYVTVGSPDKARFCEQLGAKKAINYRDQDFVEEIKAVTDGAGVDHVLDVVGQETLNRAIETLAYDGHIAIIGGLSGRADALPLRALPNGASATNIYVGSREDFEAMNEFLAEHELRPVVDRVFPFEEAAAAYEYMESGAHLGKVVISVY